MCHDTDHRGRNNAFGIASMSELALRYCDSAPLERHHCARTFEIAFCNDKCNIFKGFNYDDLMVSRRKIIHSIMSTDMALHGEAMKQLEVVKGKTTVCDDVDFLLGLFIHTADIGNPIMPLQIAQKWAELVMSEFTAQVADEEAIGLPITAMMEGLNDRGTACRSQLGFLDFVVTPLMSSIFEFFPGLQTPDEALKMSRAAW